MFYSCEQRCYSGRNIGSKKLREVMIVAGKVVLSGRSCTDKYTKSKSVIREKTVKTLVWEELFRIQRWWQSQNGSKKLPSVNLIRLNKIIFHML